MHGRHEVLQIKTLITVIRHMILKWCLVIISVQNHMELERKMKFLNPKEDKVEIGLTLEELC